MQLMVLDVQHMVIHILQCLMEQLIISKDKIINKQTQEQIKKQERAALELAERTRYQRSPRGRETPELAARDSPRLKATFQGAVQLLNE